MKTGDFIRCSSGTTHIFEVSTVKERQKLMNQINAASYRLGGIIRHEAINGLNSKLEPVLLLKSTVVKSAPARKYRKNKDQ